MEYRSKQDLLCLLLCNYSLVNKEWIQYSNSFGNKANVGLHFVKTGIITKESGNFYSDVFDLRQTGDYEDFFDFDKAAVLDLIEPANKLITDIETLLFE